MNEYRYSYFLAGYGKARWRRVTFRERFSAWLKKRRK